MFSTAGKWCYLCKRKDVTRSFVYLTWELALFQSSSHSKQYFTPSAGNSITCTRSGQSYACSSSIGGKRCFPVGLKYVSPESSVWDCQTCAGIECQIVSNRGHELFNKTCVCVCVWCCDMLPVFFIYCYLHGTLASSSKKLWNHPGSLSFSHILYQIHLLILLAWTSKIVLEHDHVCNFCGHHCNTSRCYLSYFVDALRLLTHLVPLCPPPIPPKVCNNRQSSS